jgi:hypothetical protein
MITADNARELQALAVLKRKQRQEERERQEELQALAKQLQEQSTPYVVGRLARVRERIDRVDGLLAEAVDPLDLDRLARALSTLAELERVLDGRPLPGSRRPGKERGNSSADVEPVG